MGPACPRGERGQSSRGAYMKVTLKIRRFNPEKDEKPWWGEYEVEAEPTERLLDALNHVKWYVDGTLTYRRSCAHGVCGSDAMLINGRNALACKVLLKSVGSKVTIEPMRASASSKTCWWTSNPSSKN